MSSRGLNAMPVRSTTIISVALLATACIHASTQPAPLNATDTRISVTLVDDEPEAVVRILRQRLAQHAPAAADSQQLWSTQGYRHLAERERAMRRAYSDSAFRAFVTSDEGLRSKINSENEFPRNG